MTHLFTFVKALVPGLLLLALTACGPDALSFDRPAAEPEPRPVAVSSLPPEAPALVSPSEPAAQPIAVHFAPPPAVEPAPPPLAISYDSAPREERHGGSLVVAGMADFPHRDVHRDYQETLTALGPGLAYSRLLRVSVGQEHFQPSLSLECDLCESWELTPEMAYEFQLRPDVRWHDVAPVNGRPLVAGDLAYSYARLRTPGWPGASRFTDRGIGEIEALDDHTLRVKLDFLDSDALLALADGHSKIVAPEVVEQHGGLERAPVIGTGPWIWEPPPAGASAHFSRNPAYFEPELPYLDRLTVKTVKSPNATDSVNLERIALFQADLVDVLVVSPTDWEQLRRSSLEFNARVSQQPEIGVVLSLNTQAPPLDNPAVRRAIFKAVDPWEYVDVNWSGQGDVGLGMPLPAPDWRLGRTEMHADYLASPSEARDILVNERIFFPLNLEITVADLGPDYRRLGEQVAQDLRAVGFEPTLRTVKPNYLKEALFGPSRTYQIVLGPVPPHPTTNGYLYALLHSAGPGNIVGHQDATLDAMIERQAVEPDPARRQEQLLALQRHVLEQAYMFSPVTGSYRWVFDWNLKGFYPNTVLSEYHYWAETWRQRQ